MTSPITRRILMLLAVSMLLIIPAVSAQCDQCPWPWVDPACVCPFPTWQPVNATCICPFYNNTSPFISGCCVCPFPNASCGGPSYTFRAREIAADFSANVTSGSAPLKVKFTDLSTGSPNTWLWSFGDGSSSSEKNPLHTYTMPGVYTVTLKSSQMQTGPGYEAGISSTKTKDNYITVTGSPAPQGNPASRQVSLPQMDAAHTRPSVRDVNISRWGTTRTIRPLTG